MKWRVKLSGYKSDLEDLSKSFTFEELKISKEGENYYLTSSEFDDITDAGVVLKKSEAKIGLIYGASKVLTRLVEPLKIIGIESLDDGEKTQYLFPKSITLKSSVGRPNILINGEVQGKCVYDDLRDVILLAAQDGKIAKVFRYLEAGSRDIFTLFKILEIIRKNVGGEKRIINNGWVSKDKLRLFGQTAYLERHGVHKYQTPKNPMSLDEAESLILHLVNCWLDYKLAARE